MFAATIAIINHAGQVVRVCHVNNCNVLVSSVFGDCVEAYQMLVEEGDMIQTLDADGSYVAIGYAPVPSVVFESVDDCAIDFMNQDYSEQLIMVFPDRVETL